MKIEIKNLNKYYGSHHVLKDININLENGVYGLIGPNGVGKTTLLHIILSILPFDSGEIEIEGGLEHGSQEFIANIGYLPQYPKFYPMFSAYDFLCYMCILKDIKKTEIEPLVIRLLKDVNLYTRKDDKISTFSGGMIQRLGIAQALINNPKLLVLDEPTAGLDPQERIRFRNVISKLSKEKIIIFSSHIISDIQFIADKIVIIKDGVIIRNKTKEELLAEIEPYTQNLFVEEIEDNEILKDILITSIVVKKDGYEIGFMSEERIGQPILATIEDIYMYFFGEKHDKIDAI